MNRFPGLRNLGVSVSVLLVVAQAGLAQSQVVIQGQVAAPSPYRQSAKFIPQGAGKPYFSSTLPGKQFAPRMPRGRAVRKQANGDTKSGAARAASPLDSKLSVPDPALISVLRDIAKALSDSQEVTLIEQAQDKEACTLAQEALKAALNDTHLQANRIIGKSLEGDLDKSMSTETWNSGTVTLPSGNQAALSALWAKKANGLVSLEICGLGKEESGKEQEIQYVFVLSGKSTVENGFDIQTQTPANYWLGKLSSFQIDAGRPAKPDHGLLSGQAPLLLSLCPNKPGQKESQLAQVLPAKAGSKTKMQESGAASAGGSTTPDSLERRSPVDVKAKVAAALPGDVEQTAAQQEKPAQKTPVQNKPIQVPSRQAVLVCPAKAVAGHFLTCAVLGAKDKAEDSVEVSFNGSKVVTGEDGLCEFLVPEDATPGPTLEVSLPQRWERPASFIHVVQPLANLAGNPRIDLVSQAVSKGGTLVVNGHNFDGQGKNNHVVIDGSLEARLLACSPLQIKAKLPTGLAVGAHTVTIKTQGLESAQAHFDVVVLEIQPAKRARGKGKSGELSVKAVGSELPVRLHLFNQSPEVVRLLRGNSLSVTTQGGKNNCVTVGIERLAKGDFHLQASLSQAN